LPWFGVFVSDEESIFDHVVAANHLYGLLGGVDDHEQVGLGPI